MEQQRMTPIRINRAALSRAFWDIVLDHAQEGRRDTLLEFTAECEKFSPQKPTGSINADSVWALYALANYFKPQTIIEVGTYVGRSTIALAEGQRDGYVTEPEIYTCDATNHCDLSTLTAFATNEVQVEQFKFQTSTHMFSTLAERGVVADWVHLDGRLVEPDFPHLKKLIHDNTIFSLDDFEFDQKGMGNAKALLLMLRMPFYAVIYPAPGTTTAVILPRSLLHFTEQ